MSGDRMDRYARGELSAAEARELAQASLDNPELFEEITAVALAKAAVSDRAAMKVRRFPWMAVAAAAAVAVVCISVYALRRDRPAQPVLIASNSPAEVFREFGQTTRAPRDTGSIVSMEDGEAMIDLGAIDGLVKGMQFDGLAVTTVFGERARARITGQVRQGDAVHVPAQAFFGVLLERYPDRAVEWARNHELPEGLAYSSPVALNNLGAIAEMRGDRKRAESLYAAALAGVSEANRKAVESNLARVRARW